MLSSDLNKQVMAHMCASHKHAHINTHKHIKHRHQTEKHTN